MITALISLVALTAVGSSLISNPIINDSDITYNELDDNLVSAQWHNDGSSLNEETLEFFEKYCVDYQDALNSNDVYIQEEYVSFDESLLEDNISNLSATNNSTSMNIENEYVHSKGYIKFITKAYSYGFYDGGIVYHIKVTTEQQKNFAVNQKDNLIIRHGNNAATLNLERYSTNVTATIPYTIYWTYNNNPTIGKDVENLQPNYSCSDGGVYYTFLAGKSSFTNDASTVIYGNTVVSADYYMVATDTTEVQPVYIHNYNWFVDSLSVSFGPVGVSISSGKMADIMEGQSMTLKGYKNRIENDILTLNPSDYGFEPQYFFYDKSLQHSINGWKFDSVRLRCGYIENQYVNLSPNRLNAGEAYLEYSFNKLIYEVDTNVSFWGPYEYLSSTDGDSAYIQYLDSSGNWINCLDLLNCNLSTNRNNQSYLEMHVLEGTYGIRFIATKSNPSFERNKGRICIGQTKFVSYKIN